MLIGSMSMAIGWHRYMLLDERPAKLQIINLSWPILGYFLMMAQLAIVLFVVFVLLMLFAAPFVISLFDDLPVVADSSFSYFSLSLLIYFS